MIRNARFLVGILFLLGFQMLFAQQIMNPDNQATPLQTKKVSQQILESVANFEQFNNYAPFTKGLETRNSNSPLKKSLQLKLNTSVATKLFKNADAQIELSIPSFGNESLELLLVKSDLYADGFRVVTSESNGQSVNVPNGVHYRGILKDHPETVVAFSVFENEMIGMVSVDNHNMVLLPNRDETYTLYNDKDISMDIPFSCDALEHNEHHDDHKTLNSRAAGDCVRVYIECDYALYQNKGGTANTINYITAVFNNVATLYANESVNTTISEIFVWTTADSYSKTSSIDALNQFKTARPTFNGDLAHLAALGGNNLGGVAWVDVLCTTYKYAYSNISATYNNVPTYSWTIEVMTHEMGHNLGSNHTQWCGWTGGALDNCYTTEGGCAPGPAPTNGGTIMSYCHLTSYGINFNNGFGVQPGNKIRSRIAAVNCLGTSCGGGGGTCPAPTGLNASNITQTSATISWSAVSGASSYKLEYKLASSNIWTVITTSSTSYNLTGLTLGTTYNARVLAVCSAQNSAYSTTLTFSTLGNSLYCVSKGVSAAQEWISRVKLGTIDRVSGNDGGYYDATSLSTNLTRGTTNTIYFQSGITGTVRTLYWRIWIDYNKNNSFNDPGELIISGYAATTGLLYANFIVPSGASTGTTRMRVAMKYGGLPTSCETFARGEVEDYSVNILASGALVTGNETPGIIDHVSVYPNPTMEQATVSFTSDKDQAVNFQLMDMMNKEIRQAKIYATPGENYFEMNLDNIPAGQYILGIRNGDNVMYKKIIKM